MPRTAAEPAVGTLLRQSREAMGLTLRQVEDQTERRVKNAYLSQVETGQIARPSPEVLWRLAGLYGLNYDDLLIRAGHRVAGDSTTPLHRSVNGIPLSALRDLTPAERRDVLSYIGFLRQKRPQANGSER
jgi:transcriptional regulator with XRE-family HTH domain